MSGRQLVSVHPEDLTFQFELDKQSYCDLKVANKTEHHIAFKVKTTSPNKYFVRPNMGIILPRDSCVITVTLQAQHEYPPDMQCKDKFLLQSTKVAPEINADDIPSDMFNKDSDKMIEECKLRVIYTIPPHSFPSSEGDALLTLKNSKQSPNTTSMLSSCYDEIHAVQQAKEARDSALQQTKLLQHELEMLKKRRNRKADAGFSLTFAAFVGFVGIIVGLLLNLTLSTPSVD